MEHHVLVATPRNRLVDQELPLYYHIVSRCVRRSYLCGQDPHTGRNFDHRKAWLEARLWELGRHFAVEVAAYSIMSNHFHLVVYFDPTASCGWSDSEVADRWLAVCPPNDGHGRALTELIPLHRELLLADPDRLRACRDKLGSLSVFMKFLKQPIAVRANREDGCTGHFFEARFYSGALLNGEAVLAAMGYVDLNPIRAGIADALAACESTSIQHRLADLQNTPERLKSALKPIVSGLEPDDSRLSITLEQYIDRLNVCTGQEPVNHVPQDAQAKWAARIASIHRKQRAFGSPRILERWRRRRGMRPLEQPLPG